MREATPTLEDILAASRVVARLASDDREALALAWSIRRRARVVGPAAGDRSIAGAARRLEPGSAAPARKPVTMRRLLRAAAIVCSVWADMAADPDEGASAP